MVGASSYRSQSRGGLEHSYWPNNETEGVYPSETCVRVRRVHGEQCESMTRPVRRAAVEPLDHGAGRWCAVALSSAPGLRSVCGGDRPVVAADLEP